MTLLERRTVFPFTLQYYALFSYKKAECSTCTDPLSRPRRDSAQQPTADDVRLDWLSCPVLFLACSGYLHVAGSSPSGWMVAMTKRMSLIVYLPAKSPDNP